MFQGLFSSLESSADDFVDSTKSNKPINKRKQDVPQGKLKPVRGKASDCTPEECRKADAKTYNFSDFDNYSLIVSDSPLLETAAVAKVVEPALCDLTAESSLIVIPDDDFMSPEIESIHYPTRNNCIAKTQAKLVALTSTPQNLGLRTRNASLLRDAATEQSQMDQSDISNVGSECNMECTPDVSRAAADVVMDGVGSKLDSLQLSNVDDAYDGTTCISDCSQSG